MIILCLLILLLEPADGSEGLAMNFMRNFWLSIAGFSSVFIVFVSIWLDYWIRSDQKEGDVYCILTLYL